MIGSILTFLGAITKWLSVFHPNPSIRYGIVLFGQTMAAIGQPFILNAPTKLAAQWFAENERTFANSFMSTGSVIGISLVLVYAPAVVQSDPNRIPLLNLIVASLCGFALVLVILMPKRPKTPPSTSASMEHLSFKEGLLKIFTNTHYILLLFIFGIYVAVFDVYVTLLSDYITPHGYSEQDAGNIGLTTVLSGVASTFLVSYMMDKYPYHGTALKISIGVATLGSILFLMGCQPGRLGFLFAGASCIGFGGFPIEAISLELGVESSFPVSEGTSAGLLWISAQVFGAIFLFISDAFRSRDESMHTSIIFMCCCLGVACIISLFFVNEGKRKRIDRKSAD